MAKPIRMLVVGAGRGRSHLRSFLNLPDLFEVVGVVDLDAARLQKALDEAQLPARLGATSFESALAESGCDGVMIATWARSHEPLVEQALRAGKHVLVEKPFVLQLDPARRLVELAESRGLKIVVTQQWRYKPGQRTVRRLMLEQAYGAAQTGHMVTYKARGGEYPDSEHSQLWQMTVHEMDSLISMLGQPVAEVYGHSFRPPATTWKRESTATAELTMANGARIALVSTSDARVNTFDFRVECARGVVTLHGENGFGRDETVRAGVFGQGWVVLPPDPGSTETAVLDAHVARTFAAYLDGGPEPETSGRNNLQILAALDALIESGVSGRAVKVRL
ncbi:MAG: Gfo/Idh/MocA family oxidoreductase [Actinobacteria bacterium]|nr:Gfo/Idh/MocA family oxidoreductase [Actinomycetota bacterium]